MSRLSSDMIGSYKTGTGHRLAQGTKPSSFQHYACQSVSTDTDKYTEVLEEHQNPASLQDRIKSAVGTAFGNAVHAEQALASERYISDHDFDGFIPGSVAEVPSDTELGDGEVYNRAMQTALHAEGVTKPMLKYYSSLSSASGLDVTSLPCLPSSQVRVNLSAEDLPRFSGEIFDYRDFKTGFLTMISHFPENFRLHWLKRCLDPVSKQLIDVCQGGRGFVFCRAFEILDNHYDKPKLVKQILFHRIESLADIQCAHDDKAFITVVRSIRKFFEF